jgi:HEAT repeat protein
MTRRRILIVILLLAMSWTLGLIVEDQPPPRPKPIELRIHIPPVSDRASATKVMWVINRGGPDAIQGFIEMLKRPDPPSKRTAAWALALMRSKNPDAVPWLVPMLKDDWMDSEAADALSAIGPAARAAIPDLISLLKRRSGWPRYLAAEALGNIGPDAKAGLPALREAMNDPVPLVQVAACVAVCQVDPQSKKGVLPILRDVYQNKRNFAYRRINEAVQNIDPEFLRTMNR